VSPARRQLEGTELLDRMRLVGEAFRPAAPTDRRDLFAGRTEQIGELFAVLGQPGQHAVVYGERGVGKTSLANVTTQMIRDSSVLVARATCDASDDFGSVWRKALEDIVIRKPTRGIGFAPAESEDVDSASRLLASAPVTPNAVRKALASVTRAREIAVVVDEFDRLSDHDARTLFADTIKLLSDHLVGATIILVGVADDIDELIREHGSVERALVQIHMPRMSREELGEIVRNGMAHAQLTIGKTAVERIAALSQGLPHYTHLLGQHAAQAALSAGRGDVTLADVDRAVSRAIDRAQQSIMDAYRRATTSARRSMYPEVLLASALASEDEYGFFSAADVRERLASITGREVPTASFAQHLDELAGDDRGPVLQKRGAPRRFRYRFVNPLLQPYVVMRGVSEGAVNPKGLR
jgi:Cdc6-like AAA superfamily ATPase